MQAVVTRAFGGPDGVEYVLGQLVDVTDWKWKDKLLDQRFIRPATQEEIDTAVEVAAESSVPLKAKRASKKRGTR